MRLRRAGQKRTFDPLRCRSCGRLLTKLNTGADLGDGSFLCRGCFRDEWNSLRRLAAKGPIGGYLNADLLREKPAEEKHDDTPGGAEDTEGHVLPSL